MNIVNLIYCKIRLPLYHFLLLCLFKDVLNAYKKRYNDFPSFCFQHYYSQDHCNAFDCKNTKIARLMDSMQWKYCEKHLKSNRSLLLGWEITINSTFKDLREGVQLTKEEAVLHYSSYFFNEKETKDTKETTTKVEWFRRMNQTRVANPVLLLLLVVLKRLISSIFESMFCMWLL